MANTPLKLVFGDHPSVMPIKNGDIAVLDRHDAWVVPENQLERRVGHAHNSLLRTG